MFKPGGKAGTASMSLAHGTIWFPQLGPDTLLNQFNSCNPVIIFTRLLLLFFPLGNWRNRFIWRMWLQVQSLSLPSCHLNLRHDPRVGITTQLEASHSHLPAARHDKHTHPWFFRRGRGKQIFVKRSFVRRNILSVSESSKIQKQRDRLFKPVYMDTRYWISHFFKKLLFLGKFLDKKVHGSSRRRELSNNVVRIHQEKKILLCFYSCVMNRSIFLTSNILCWMEWLRWINWSFYWYQSKYCFLWNLSYLFHVCSCSRSIPTPCPPHRVKLHFILDNTITHMIESTIYGF